MVASTNGSTFTYTKTYTYTTEKHTCALFLSQHSTYTQYIIQVFIYSTSYFFTFRAVDKKTRIHENCFLAASGTQRNWIIYIEKNTVNRHAYFVRFNRVKVQVFSLETVCIIFINSLWIRSTNVTFIGVDDMIRASHTKYLFQKWLTTCGIQWEKG